MNIKNALLSFAILFVGGSLLGVSHTEPLGRYERTIKKSGCSPRKIKRSSRLEKKAVERYFYDQAEKVALQQDLIDKWNDQIVRLVCYLSKSK